MALFSGHCVQCGRLRGLHGPRLFPDRASCYSLLLAFNGIIVPHAKAEGIIPVTAPALTILKRQFNSGAGEGGGVRRGGCTSLYRSGGLTDCHSNLGRHSVNQVPAAERKEATPSVGFIALAFVSVVLIVAIGIKNRQTQKDNARTQQTMQGDLAAARQDARDTKQELVNSRLAQEYMKGRLSGLSLMVGKINETGITGNKEVAAALGKVVQAQDTRSALEKMSSPVLRANVLQFAKGMIE